MAGRRSTPVDRLVAWKWRCQIESADDPEAIAEVKRIAGLGEAGLPELAGLLGSERLCVAETGSSGSRRRDAPLARFRSGRPRRRRQLDPGPGARKRTSSCSAPTPVAWPPTSCCEFSATTVRVTDASESAIVAGLRPGPPGLCRVDRRGSGCWCGDGDFAAARRTAAAVLGRIRRKPRATASRRTCRAETCFPPALESLAHAGRRFRWPTIAIALGRRSPRTG